MYVIFLSLFILKFRIKGKREREYELATYCLSHFSDFFKCWRLAAALLVVKLYYVFMLKCRIPPYILQRTVCVLLRNGRGPE